jgi:metal-dependent amidase/aminoacylase/carboxypeptidase family protein
MLLHPRDTTYLDRGSLAINRFQVEFFGKSAHASSAPERGISALDAVLQVFFSINQLRQMFKPHTRVHGVITHGGDAPNVIPDYAAADFLLRSADQTYLDELTARFLNIVEGAALATGATSQVTRGVSYKQRVSNTTLVQTFGTNLEELGIDYETPPADAGVGSSDIGDVSQLVPTIHPYLQICERGIGNHTPEFADAAAGPLADELLAAGATALAWTAADVLVQPELREQLRVSFREQLGREPA